MNRNIWNQEVPSGVLSEATDEDLNLYGRKPILAKKSENEELAINVLREISETLDNLHFVDIEEATLAIYCQDLANEAIKKIEGKDE